MAADAVPLGQPDYTGTVGGDPGATVQFRVAAGTAKSKKAIFEVRDLTVACQGPVDMQVTLEPVRAPFSSSRKFRREIYSMAPNGDERFIEINGQLLSRGRSEGSLTYYSDPANPPGSAAPADCLEVAIWKARKAH